MTVVGDILPGVDPAAAAYIKAYCGWHVAPVITETVVLDGQGGWSLILPTLRLTDLTEVTSDGAAVDGLQWSEAGMVRGCHWSHKLRGIQVTMTHGYEDTPPELVAAGVRITDLMAATAGVASETTGPFTVSYRDMSVGGSGLGDPYVAAVLDRYRLPFKS